MLPWWWIIIFFSLGGCFGVVFMALMVAAREEDRSGEINGVKLAQEMRKRDSKMRGDK